MDWAGSGIHGYMEFTVNSEEKLNLSVSIQKCSRKQMCSYLCILAVYVFISCQAKYLFRLQKKPTNIGPIEITVIRIRNICHLKMKEYLDPQVTEWQECKVRFSRCEQHLLLKKKKSGTLNAEFMVGNITRNFFFF